MTTFNILHIFIGFIGLIAIAIPFSNNYKIINYRYVFYGIISQLFLAAILLKLPIVINFFELLGNGVTILQNATIEGAGFVFGYPPTEDTSPYRSLLETFAFGVLPYIIVMSCISAILWYWGILPFIVNIISKGCQKLFNIGGPVGLGAAANVFIGQVEAPLLIKPYIDTKETLRGIRRLPRRSAARFGRDAERITHTCIKCGYRGWLKRATRHKGCNKYFHPSQSPRA